MFKIHESWDLVYIRLLVLGAKINFTINSDFKI